MYKYEPCFKSYSINQELAVFHFSIVEQNDVQERSDFINVDGDDMISPKVSLCGRKHN